MGLFFNKNKDKLGEWMNSASDEDLSDVYEEKRQEWVRTGFNGDGERTSEMKRIDREMSRRNEEKWEKDPNRKHDPNYRWTDENRWE